MVLPEVQLDKVVVHPLVLLSVVDHFNRMGKIGNQKRVVGLLLGNWSSRYLLFSISLKLDLIENSWITNDV